MDLRLCQIKKNTAIAWFTAANNTPEIKVAFLEEDAFCTPFVINDLNAVGRVDIVFINNNEVLVSYMESDTDHTYLQCKKVSKTGEVSKTITISKISSERSTGVPQLEFFNNTAYIVWTTLVEDGNQLKTVKFSL